MAKKTIFQDINLEKYKDLGYDTTCLEKYGIPINNTGDNIGLMLFTESSDDHDDILSTLQTETGDKISNCKKAFVLSGMDVSMDRIKEALKEHKITVTNDYEKADCIVTNEYVCDEHDNTFRSTKLLHHKQNMYVVNEHFAESFYHETGCHTIFCDKVSGNWSIGRFDYEDAPYDLYGISGLAIELAHRIKVEKDLAVFDVDTILNSSANIQTLTEELCQQLITMINGGTDDRELAGKILPTIDIEKNVHLLWHLAREAGNRIDYSYTRNKDVKWWADKARISHLAYKTAEQAIIQFEQEGKLTAQGFKFLEPICRQEISIHNRELYVFKVQVKPEYRKYFKHYENQENN